MSLEKNYNSAKPAASMFNQNGNTQSPLFGTLSRGFNVSHIKIIQGISIFFLIISIICILELWVVMARGIANYAFSKQAGHGQCNVISIR